MGRSSRIVLQHDLARVAVQRVNRWEYLTGITDAEREQMRAERLARGEPYDYEPGRRRNLTHSVVHVHACSTSPLTRAGAR
ncbi:hypothetical protein [Nonomuraea zeae]|uniref:Uncharacterized protein n=1 Tax=Nonomuraea zeae TaxID=1642303 RepID=A0A5S4H1Y7_9ACTN|nr:hypothetical protein [Nonomuraea zeae]TMR39245.1 hypothetical protein ETD85_02435 [Nonomuraea zeae]